jgi:hypothetical protein
MQEFDLFDVDFPLPFQANPMFSLHAVGAWENGGILEIRFKGKRTDLFRLAAAEWSVLADVQRAVDPSAVGPWGHMVIQSDARFGYRFGLPPEQLHLTVVEDDDEEED